MRVTKREVLFSIVIAAVMIILGFVIHGSINDSLMEEYQKYNTALQIQENHNQFEYGMKTDVGYAFVYGDLKAVDTVTYPEIGGEYSYIEKVKEKYTMHTRTVIYTTGSGKTRQTHTRVETYWTWDRVGSEEMHCNKISFLDVEFDYGKISFPSSSYIDTIKESSKIRYKYYGVGTKYTGTLFAFLKDNTINQASFYNNTNIEDTISGLETGWQLVVFWIFWIALIGFAVYGFCYLENRWLEDK